MNATTPRSVDVIDQVLQIQAGDHLDKIRQRRPQAKLHAQQSHASLFQPDPLFEAGFPQHERHAVAYFTVLLQGQTAGIQGLESLHLSALQALHSEPSITTALQEAAHTAREQGSSGPYGHYPPGPLTIENQDGPTFVLPESIQSLLGVKLAAALEHTHLLVFHPRDAQALHLQKLLSAGWSTPAIVTLSQLVSFLSFQIRVVSGLSVLSAQRPSFIA
jgi:CMD domain protein